MASHVLFDFFGTLVEYSPSRTDQGYDRSFSLLRGAGFRGGYEEFLSLWSRVSSEFDRVAESSHREFSMDELVESFLERALGSAPAGLTTRFVEAYLAECSSRCSSSSHASRSFPVEATHRSSNGLRTWQEKPYLDAAAPGEPILRPRSRQSRRQRTPRGSDRYVEPYESDSSTEEAGSE